MSATKIVYKDPTENVHDAINREVRRLNDLYSAESRRLDEAMIAERRRIDEQLALRAHYDLQLSLAESKRIDAIRAVDVNAVSIANEKATVQATVLANQVSTSAETLRALVAATAQAVAQQLTQLSAQFTDRLSVLEKTQYERQGRGTGMEKLWGWVFGGIALIVSVYIGMHK